LSTFGRLLSIGTPTSGSPRAGRPHGRAAPLPSGFNQSHRAQLGRTRPYTARHECWNRDCSVDGGLSTATSGPGMRVPPLYDVASFSPSSPPGDYRRRFFSVSVERTAERLPIYRPNPTTSMAQRRSRRIGATRCPNKPLARIVIGTLGVRARQSPTGCMSNATNNITVLISSAHLRR